MITERERMRHGSGEEGSGRGSAIAAWVLYDWAYGAFTTIVSTFVIAAYFTQAVASDPAAGASEWAGAQAAAGLAVALLAAPLGAVADSGGGRRMMLGLATAVMAACTLGLWTVHPYAGHATRALVLVATATVAFEIGTVFYNAMLPGLARPGRLGRLSMLAWGAGYAGGLCCLALCLLLLVRPNPALFGLDRAAAEQVRACAVLAAAWIATFGWPCCVFVADAGPRRPWRGALSIGLAQLRAVLRRVMADRPMRLFLLARLLYTDGLTTLFAFGGIYAAGEFGLDAQGVLLFGIGLTVTAGVGVLAFAFIEDRIGSRGTVLASVLALAVLGTALLLTHERTVFWILGLLLGVFVGPAQAASRSMMATLAPPADRASYFGLFALSGRVTAFVGPLAFGLITALTGSQRAGMTIIVYLLLAGAFVLARMPYQAPSAARRARSAT